MQNSHEQFRQSLEAAFQSARDYIENLDVKPVGATADLPTLRKQLSRPLTNDGMPPEQVVSELARDVQGGLIGTGTGRFFGWLIGGSLSRAPPAPRPRPARAPAPPPPPPPPPPATLFWQN